MKPAKKYCAVYTARWFSPHSVAPNSQLGVLSREDNKHHVSSIPERSVCGLGVCIIREERLFRMKNIWPTRALFQSVENR